MIYITTIIFALLYNFLIFPILFLLAHLLALFNKKIRSGIVGRYQTNRSIREFRSQLPENTSIFLFHCASMGEFEHIRPVLRALKKKYPGCANVVSFFSPSGYNNVKTNESIDLTVYSPFDWWWPTWRFYQNLDPDLLLIAKYDVWPNQIWLATMSNIPTMLINATLQDNSGRINSFSTTFQKQLYHYFTLILAVDPSDAVNYEKLAPKHNIHVSGDTKYDQVLYRFGNRRTKSVIPETILANRKVFIAGSSWPEDETHLIPALQALATDYPQLLIIFCPHEPTADHLSGLREAAAPSAVRHLADISNYQSGEWVLIDRIGVLADLYAIADIAYVGGSFKQNVHNVLEPAVFGIPVLIGPVNLNSHEAQLLKNGNGCFEIRNSQEIEKTLQALLADPASTEDYGRKAQAVINGMGGATDRLLGEIERLQPATLSRHG